MNRTLWPSQSERCQVVGAHSPEPLLLAAHHIVPASWAGGPGTAGETLLVCFGCHENIHVLIDDLVAGRPMRAPRTNAAQWAAEAITRARAAGAVPRPTL